VASEPIELPAATLRRFQRRCPVTCAWVGYLIESLADYISVVSGLLIDDGSFWFRGHRDTRWNLIPGALRYEEEDDRATALGLLDDFRRVAELKVPRPPSHKERLKWMQLAQHYGMPTRLLDWTQSATFALYFACVQSEEGEGESDGAVFLVNPAHLAELPGTTGKTSLDALTDEDISPYLDLGPALQRRGVPTIAINPVWNSERVMVQRGAFTLHGSQQFELDDQQAPSLSAIPILGERKTTLLEELARIGVDEMTLFPELEHACAHLKRRAGL
jgi:hypothetical protein